MAQFVYRAKNKEGQNISGIVEAADKPSALNAITQRELYPISVELKKEDFLQQFKKILGRVSLNELVAFTRQLSTMISAGIPLIETFTILEAQSANPKLKEVVVQIRQNIEGGSSLSQAFSQHPKIFNNVYVNLIRVGEASGKLDTILETLAANVEKSSEFRAKVRAALTYPALITFAMVVVFVFLMVYVVPQLTAIYDSFTLELPIQTKIVIFISDFFVNQWYILLIAIPALIFVYSKFKATDKGGKLLSKISLKIPILGNLNRNVEITEFARTMSLMVEAGIPIVDALNVVAGSMRSNLFKEAVLRASNDVSKGLPISSSLANESLFPPILISMMAVGEKTGKLSEVLSKLSKFLEAQVTHTVEGLASTLEPIILLALGGMVGFLVYSIIIPIYMLTQSFG